MPAWIILVVAVWRQSCKRKSSIPAWRQAVANDRLTLLVIPKTRHSGSGGAAFHSRRSSSLSRSVIPIERASQVFCGRFPNLDHALD
jgi:hypothetical protein